MRRLDTAALLRLALDALPWLPFAALVVFVIGHAVDVPYDDQWALVPIFDRLATLELRFEDLFGFHNEHRLLAPILVLAPLALLTGWDVRAEIALNVVLGALSFFVLRRLLGPPRDAAGRAVEVAVSSLVFSIAAWENWVLGIQVSWWLVELPLLFALWMLGRAPGTTFRRLAFAAAAAGVASLSEAQGLLLWLVLVPVVVSSAGADRRAFAAWALSGLACGLLYAIGLQATREWTTLPDTAGTGAFALTLLGAPLARVSLAHPALAAPSIGLAIVVSFVVLVALSQRRLAPAQWAPWFSLGAYAVGFAVLVAVGRGAGGTAPAFAPRYVGHGALLLVATLALAAGLAQGRNARRLVGAASGLVLVAHLVTAWAARHDAGAFRDRLLQGQACFELIRLFDPRELDEDQTCFTELYPGRERPGARRLWDHALALAGLGFRRFPANHQVVTQPAETVYGYLDAPPEVRSDGARPLSLPGWARPIYAGDGPPLVLFRRLGDTRWLAAALPMHSSPDVAQALGHELSRVRFVARFPTRLLPEGESIVEAWAWDRPRQRFLPLVGRTRVSVARAPPATGR